jgi:threonine synthase
VHGTCSCGSPLLVEYDLDAVAAAVTPRDVQTRAPTMWRYRELLPVGDEDRIIWLGEGMTPLLRLDALASRTGCGHLYVKDEGPNPTGTFKARGAACGVTMAAALGLRDVALPTAGNAGAAWACYGAAAGLRVHIAMPSGTPELVQLECRLHGADVSIVPGLLPEAAHFVAERSREAGWFDVATLREPYRLEGKKSLAFEIAEQLQWSMPEVVIYPAGGGVGILGIWRALQQLKEVGWVQGPLPRLVVVQPTGCAPIVRAFEEGLDESRRWNSPSSIASGLVVPKALGDFLVLRAIRDTGGTAVAVSDDDILGSIALLARSSGILACPEGAATLAALLALLDDGRIARDERIVLINTGSGLKYRGAMRRATLGGA